MGIQQQNAGKYSETGQWFVQVFRTEALSGPSAHESSPCCQATNKVLTLLCPHGRLADNFRFVFGDVSLGESPGKAARKIIKHITNVSILGLIIAGRLFINLVCCLRSWNTILFHGFMWRGLPQARDYFAWLKRGKIIVDWGGKKTWAAHMIWITVR